MDFIVEYFFNFGEIWGERGRVLEAFWITLKLSIISGALSLAWGLALSVLRQLPIPSNLPGKVGVYIVRWMTIAYIDIFRGIPLLLVLLLVSSTLGAFASEGVIPRSLGFPEWLGQTSAFWWGVMSLTITYGAYMAEVYRAGIEAVPAGQSEAARSLGMSHGQAMRHVIIPQAVRKVIPPLLNDFIALMKDTSLVSILGIIEIVQLGGDLQSEFFTGAGYIVGAMLFLLVTIPLARLIDYQIAKQQRRTQRSGSDGDAAPRQTGMAGA